jgi:2-polyprenyl-3-methyl-5-hydroxy-6-metoxy-1,4-benzoquinol methylase
MSFWTAKTLLSATQLGLFTELANGPLELETISTRLNLHPRSARDFLDALVALGLLERKEGLYTNTAETDLFLDREKPTYAGGLLELAETRLYPVWGSLTEALHTGLPQNEAKQVSSYYANLCSDRERLRTFLHAMIGLSLDTSREIAKRFAWKRYRTFVDIGGAIGALSEQIALAHAHVTGGSFDLPAVGEFCDEYFAARGLCDRLKFYSGDFFEDELPKADVLVMGHVLTNWNLEEKRLLISKAYAALPPGGVLLVYDPLIDEDRSSNAFGLLHSLNMLLVTSGGFAYTGSECSSWMREAGFHDIRVEELTATESMVVGIKPDRQSPQ